MPTIKRKVIRRLIDEHQFCEEKRTQLLTGCDFFNDGYAYGDNPDAETLKRMRADWKRHRAELIAEHLAPVYHDPDTGEPKYGSDAGPGTRPWGWWAFEAPEPRRLISGRCTPLTDRLHEGIPALYNFDSANPPEWECQADYLERLGLLTDSEKRHFAEEDQKELADRGKPKQLIKFKSKKGKIKTRRS
jgi:hypothetical protein